MEDGGLKAEGMALVYRGTLRGSLDVAVLVGISSTCSISSCFTISSASTAWPGESEPDVTENWIFNILLQ